MKKDFFKKGTNDIVQQNLSNEEIAEELCELWKQGETKSTNLVKKEQRDLLENLGIAVSALKTIGQVAGKYGKTSDLEKYAQLSELLWNNYGREGRIVACHILNSLNEKAPDKILLICKNLVAECTSWEECDNMTYGVEPIFRKFPEERLNELNSWLADDNKWVKRVALNVLARLPMKKPDFTKQCLEMITPCLGYDDNDVRRTCSFAIRLSARGNINDVYNYLEDNIGGSNSTKVWIFSDVIKSMTKSFLPTFKPLLPLYEKWRNDLSDKHALRSIESAIKLLKK
jgi:3-methyladenine DNA glycosylase AlkD